MSITVMQTANTVVWRSIQAIYPLTISPSFTQFVFPGTAPSISDAGEADARTQDTAASDKRYCVTTRTDNYVDTCIGIDTSAAGTFLAVNVD